MKGIKHTHQSTGRALLAAAAIMLAAMHAFAGAEGVDSTDVDRAARVAYRSVQEPLNLPEYDFSELPRDYKLSDVEVFADTVDARHLQLDTTVHVVMEKGHYARGTQQSIYSLPYSLTGRCYDWKRLWVNTGVLTGAFVGTLFVLELLPEDATSWNRASLQDVPLFTRWRNHVLRDGPEWDHDKFIFNYVLHPYAGAAYFMAARSCGFNFYQSLLYSTLISNVGWEFGIEAFMERPSYQDLFITPLVGSAIGEGFYRLKRKIVDNNYHLLGSRFLGNVVAFLIDPVNEIVGYFGHNPARQVGHERAWECEAATLGAKAYPRKAPTTVSFVPGPTSLSLTVNF